jgi:hypothetical protein
LREAIGGTWLFQIVIFFILLFTGFMCLTINHSKAYGVKSEILEVIERYNGVDLSTDSSGSVVLEEIANILKHSSYRTTGKCPADVTSSKNKLEIVYQGYNREGKKDKTNPAFCLAEVKMGDKNGSDIPQQVQELPNMRYYRVVVFYQLDLPVFNELFMFSLTGDTKVMSVSR